MRIIDTLLEDAFTGAVKIQLTTNSCAWFGVALDVVLEEQGPVLSNYKIRDRSAEVITNTDRGLVSDSAPTSLLMSMFGPELDYLIADGSGTILQEATLRYDYFDQGKKHGQITAELKPFPKSKS